MPREARIDAPGTLHHIIVRGIEKREIFIDHADRQNFIERLGDILGESRTPYIHLNPFRAKQVSGLKELERYPYCGHSVILGKHRNDWQSVRA